MSAPRNRTHRWRNGATPATIILPIDRDLLDDKILDDAREHVRKLRGLVLYSRAEVQPVVIAGWIDKLLKVIERLRTCKSVARARELEENIKVQKKELMRLLRIELDY